MKTDTTPKTGEPPSSESPSTLCCASFTPGPWHITRSDHSDHVDVWQESGIGHIAAVSTGLLPDASAMSNARLIAASPKLFAALKNITTLFDWMDGPEGWREACEQAKEALDQASLQNDERTRGENNH